MTELLERIAIAERAQAALDEQDRLREDARQLAGLKQQLANAQWCEGAAPLADNAEQQARQLLQAATPKMQQWQHEFMGAYTQLCHLLDALPALQAEIDAAARHCQQAAATRQRIAQLQGKPAHELGGLLADNDWYSLWQEIGGTSPELSPLPSGTNERYQRLDPLVALLAKRPLALYNPATSNKRYRG